MKKIKLLFSLIVLSLMILSCSNDDKPNNIDKKDENVMFVDGQKVNLNYAFIKKYNGYHEILISDSDMSKSDLTEVINYTGIIIDSKKDKVQEGTYTFLKDSDPNFNPKTNFTGASVGYNLIIKNGAPEMTEKTYFDDVLSGKIIIKGNNDFCKITFEIKFKNKTIKGNYEGKISNM